MSVGSTVSHERPLGVRADLPLAPGQVSTLRVLAEYDLSLISERMRRDGTLPATWLQEAIFEFRRYLGLRVLAPGYLPMLSHPVDVVWHTCLLFSRQYAAWCQEAFGEFVHHEPAAEPDPDPASSWKRFADAYADLYGSPPGRMWHMGQYSD